MLRNLTLLLLLGLSARGQSQSFFGKPDTLLIQTFTVDPSDTMLLFPSGDDKHWVNWDGDNLKTLCGEGVMVPGGWFWDKDLGDTSSAPTNAAFTSCSYLVNKNVPNNNWLITPPVYIPDSSRTLSWRSHPLEGPGYLDGYLVLASAYSNDPFSGNFTDTLFRAAEMKEALIPGTLNPDGYIFSPGYIHANRFTDTAYFFLPFPGAGGYTGKFEPHTRSLAKYAGQTIYIAFVHNSSDDSTLQLDDITIATGKTSAQYAPVLEAALARFYPNPAHHRTNLLWMPPHPGGDGLLTIASMDGRTALRMAFSSSLGPSFPLDLDGLQPGVYRCTLQTTSVQQTLLLVKQ